MQTEAYSDFKDLKVWQLSVDLAASIYSITSTFPTGERYGLIDQMRRAAVLISSSIAEGSGRNSTKEFLHFLSIAKGSLRELESLVEVAVVLCLVATPAEVREKCKSVGRMLTRLRQSLESKL